MTETLVWDDAGARYYETGVSKGTFFPINGDPGVPWNGLISVNLDPQGGERESYYFDGTKYMERILAEDFQATIQAISTPREFRACEGVREYAPGVMTEMNKRDKFHMTWRTEISSDAGESIGYKLHIAYNNLVQPAGRNFQTIADTTTLDIRNFVISATPACGRHSYFWFDSREYDLTALEAQISLGVLPKCQDLAGLVSPAPGGGGDGGGGGADPDADCPSMIETFEEYIHGQTVNETKTVGTGKIGVHGRINNGLDIIELPAVGAFAANDSAASEVGTGDILADDDDATYITSADGDLGYTVGLPPLVGYVAGCALELHVRMSITGGVDPDDPDNLDADVQIHISTDNTGDTTVGGFSDGADEGMGFALSAVDGTIVDYVVPLSLVAWHDVTMDDVVTALEAGAYLSVVAASNNNPDPADTPIVFRLYEAKVVMLNDTQPDKFLRVIPGEDQAFVELGIPEVTPSPDVASNTTRVDFKISPVPFVSDGSGDIGMPLCWNNLDAVDQPGQLAIQLVGDNPFLKWYSKDLFSGGVELASAALETDVWYTAIADWSWTTCRIRVAKASDPEDYLIDHTHTTTVDPVVYSGHFADLVGNGTVTYEVVIDNAKIQVHCHDEDPGGGGTPTNLHPGAITWDTPTGIFDSGNRVGTLPLQDGSDSTYIGIESDGDGSTITYINRAVAPVYETYSGTPTTMTVRIRADIQTNDPAGGARLSIGLEDSDGSPAVILTPSGPDWILADTGGTIQDYSFVMSPANFTFWGTTLAAIASVIASGTAKFVIQLNVSSTGPAVHSFVHLYHVEVELS